MWGRFLLFEVAIGYMDQPILMPGSESRLDTVHHTVHRISKRNVVATSRVQKRLSPLLGHSIGSAHTIMHPHAAHTIRTKNKSLSKNLAVANPAVLPTRDDPAPCLGWFVRSWLINVAYFRSAGLFRCPHICPYTIKHWIGKISVMIYVILSSPFYIYSCIHFMRCSLILVQFYTWFVLINVSPCVFIFSMRPIPVALPVIYFI